MDRPQIREDGEEPPEPPRLRLLRRLVTLLMAVLILAVIAVVALLVIRLVAEPRPVTLALPETIRLPADERAEAATLGRGWVLVVTRDAAGRERLRLYEAETGRLRQTVELAPP